MRTSYNENSHHHYCLRLMQQLIEYETIVYRSYKHKHLSYHEGIKFNISNYPVISVELLGLAVICKKNNTQHVLV